MHWCEPPGNRRPKKTGITNGDVKCSDISVREEGAECISKVGLSVSVRVNMSIFGTTGNCDERQGDGFNRGMDVRYYRMTMSERTESVINQALSLSPIERAELIERLYESMRSEGEKAIEQAWAQESERRIDLLQSGQESTVPYEQMKRELSAGDR